MHARRFPVGLSTQQVHEHLYRSAKVSNIALASVRRDPWSTSTTATSPLTAALRPAAALACGRLSGMWTLAESCDFRAASFALLAQAPGKVRHLRAALFASAIGRWMSGGSMQLRWQHCCLRQGHMSGSTRWGGRQVSKVERGEIIFCAEKFDAMRERHPMQIL